MTDRHVLVLGGQRSGKSRFAETLVESSGLDRVYVATATAGDGEMAARIAAHKARRGDGWTTIEEPLDLAGVIQAHAGPDRAVLVDCLTLWLSNLAGRRSVDDATAELVAAIAAAPGALVIVSGEVGSGIIPTNAAARTYADDLGRLNQAVAEAVGRVVLVVAGQPVTLKPASGQVVL